MILRLTEEEKKALRRLLRVGLEDAAQRERSFRVLNPKDPKFGRLMAGYHGDEDITDETAQDKRDALAFLRRLKKRTSEKRVSR